MTEMKTASGVVIEGEFDENERLIVSDERDKPPIGRECASVCFFDIDEKRVLRIVGVYNIAPYKRHSLTLPGGTKKGSRSGKTREMENPFETALEEAEEEVGIRRVDGTRLTVDDYYPILFANVQDEPLRDINGEKIMVAVKRKDGSEKIVQQRGTIPHFVFAHFGPVLLNETTDKKTKEPQWCTLKGIMDSTRSAFAIESKMRSLAYNDYKSRRSLEKKREKVRGWSPKHIVLWIQTLRMIGEGLSVYSAGEMTDERDRAFYEQLWQGTKTSVDWVYMFEDWMKLNIVNGFSLDPGLAMYELFESQTKAEAFVNKFQFDDRLVAAEFDIKSQLLLSAKEKRQQQREVSAAVQVQ